MAYKPLRPASIFQRFIEIFFTPKIEVEFNADFQEGASVKITPIFKLDGMEVPASKLTRQKYQSISGHHAKLSNEAEQALLEVGPNPVKYTKRKASELIRRYSSNGIKTLNSRGDVIKVEKLTYETDLALNGEETLKVSNHLATKDGVIVSRPTADPAQPGLDDNWIVADEKLFEVPEGDRELANILGNTEPVMEFRDDLVPEVIEKLDGAAKKGVAVVNKDPALAKLKIHDSNPYLDTMIEGDATAIALKPCIGYEFGNTTILRQPAVEQSLTSTPAPRNYTRVGSGWVKRRHQQEQELLGEFKSSLGAIAQRGKISGEDIPEAISGALKQAKERPTWRTFVDPKVRDHHRLVEEKAQVQFKISVQGDTSRSFLQLDPIYVHQKMQLDHNEVDDVRARNKRWVRRRDAWVQVDADKYSEICTIAARNGLKRNDAGFMFDAGQRQEVLDIFNSIGVFQYTDSYREFIQKLAEFERIEEAPLPDSLRAEVTLRPYQQHGYNWLDFLRKFGLHGILADDMGLGKTLQTLAVIRRSQEIAVNPRPALIVCPTSVVRNWALEAQKFFDGFRLITYTGNSRAQLIDRIKQHANIVITSYGIAANDWEQLNKISWDYLVLDEAHNVKNPEAMRTKAVKRIGASNRLSLTGTPIQNRPEELWSLFEILMPGYLGKRAAFNNEYKVLGLINTPGFKVKAQKLRERIHPFVMRRLKKDVAKDLPERFIISRPVELSAKQVALYRAFTSSKDFQNLKDELERVGVNRAVTAIVAVYTKLRNICNHPALETNEKAILAEDSGKLETLLELMEELKEGEHRALLFCQSTRMLDIIGDFLQKQDYKTLRLDGSTPQVKRQGLVDEFNNNSKINCFLISTKAGGTGLNLTGADTVIFYDHDWNPANDQQAQDRAYRIGQTKNVTVYKLVSSGTIEERIIERQSAKSMMAEAVIGTDAAGFKDLTKEQLLSLFEYTGNGAAPAGGAGAKVEKDSSNAGSTGGHGKHGAAKKQPAAEASVDDVITPDFG